MTERDEPTRTPADPSAPAPPVEPDLDAAPSDAVLEELLAAFSTTGNVVELRPSHGTGAVDRERTARSEPTEPTVRASPAGHVVTGPEPSPARHTIVIGDDDGLPDPVHLDEEGEARLRAVHGRADDDPSARSTFVIGDELDASGAFDAVPVAAPSSMDPRVRARRIAVRRAEGRRRLLWVGIVAAVVLVVVGIVAVFASSLFAVRTVDVEGETYTDPALLARVIEDLKGTPVLLVDEDAAERELESDPWVERAEVTTDFPHEARIDIRERRPLATYAGSDGHFRVLDVDGRVLAVTDGRPIAYMLLTGPAPDVAAGQDAGPPYAAAAELVAALPPELRSITRSIAVDSGTGNLTLLLGRPDGRDVEVRIGTVDQLEGKLARVVQEVRAGIEDVTALDASTDGISETRG